MTDREKLDWALENRTAWFDELHDIPEAGRDALAYLQINHPHEFIAFMFSGGPSPERRAAAHSAVDEAIARATEPPDPHDARDKIEEDGQ